MLRRVYSVQQEILRLKRLNDSDMPTYKKARTGSYKKSKYYKGKSYPIYKAPKPSYSLVYPIERNCVVNYLYSRQLGFQNVGLTVSSPYLGFAFSLQQASPFIGGTYDGTSAGSVPNYSELAAVFDQFRIKKIVCTVFYSHNSSATGDALLPILRQALDFDSVDGTNSLNEYQNMKVHQMGDTPAAGFKYWLTTPTVQGAVQDTLASVGSANAISSPWLDSNASLTPHYGMRFEASNFGDTTTGLTGRFQFIFKYSLEFRRPR